MQLFNFSLAALAVTFYVAQASSIIRNPISTVLVVKEPIIHTSRSSVHARKSFSLTFWMGTLHVKLDLEPNRDILDESATPRHLTSDGKTSHLGETPMLQYKVFKGQAWTTNAQKRHRWHPVGWARVLILQDGKKPSFEGVFTVGGDHHHIQLSQRYMRTKHHLDPRVPVEGDECMIIWRDSDVLRPSGEIQNQDLRRGLNEEQAICHADRLPFNSVATHPVFNPTPRKSGVFSSRNRFGKEVELSQSVTSHQNSRGLPSSPFVSTIGQTTGCFSKPMVARVGIAADCTYTRDFDSTESVKQNVVQMINAASAVWEDTFNITIALADLVISNSSCLDSPSLVSPWNQDCNAGISLQQRLSLFSDWRTKQHDTYSHWTLLSTCQNGSTIGLAWLGQTCVRDNVDSNSTIAEDAELNDNASEQTVSGANLVVRTAGAEEWQVFAHETAHLFGAVHDCTSQACSTSSTAESTHDCCPANASTCASEDVYMMHPSSAHGIRSFSPCSIGNICSAIGRRTIDTSCLRLSRQMQESSWSVKYKSVTIAVPCALGLAVILALGAYFFCRFRHRKGSKDCPDAKLVGTDTQVGNVQPLTKEREGPSS